jgi:hypothetical protein
MLRSVADAFLIAVDDVNDMGLRRKLCVFTTEK